MGRTTPSLPSTRRVRGNARCCKFRQRLHQQQQQPNLLFSLSPFLDWVDHLIQMFGNEETQHWAPSEPMTTRLRGLKPPLSQPTLHLIGTLAVDGSFPSPPLPSPPGAHVQQSDGMQCSLSVSFPAELIKALHISMITRLLAPVRRD